MRLHKLFAGVLGAGMVLATAAFADNVPGDTSFRSNDQMGAVGAPGSVGTKNVASDKQISGTISSVGSDKIMLKANDGSKLTLQTDPATKFFDQSGNKASLTQLQEGAQIRASYDILGDQNHALRVDVIGAKSDDSMKSNKPY